MRFSIYLFVGCVLLLKPLPSICSELTSKVEEDQLSRGISKFSQDLLQQCSKSESKNIIISPYSVAMALSLLSQATNGVTFDEIRKGLHLSINKTEIAHQFHEYYELLRQNAGQSELNVVNQMYVQQGYTLKADFKEVATKKFFSSVEHVNFQEANKTAIRINQFVKEVTKEKIQNIVQAEMFQDADTYLFLLNAIYLKGEWAHKFDKQATFRHYFYVNETENVVVDYITMSQKMWTTDVRDLDSVALRLDYANSNLSFVIVLPKNNRTGLQALESKIAGDWMSRIIDGMILDTRKVTIPKFRVESSINLNEILIKMGMASMFDVRYSDLSGSFNESRKMYVKNVVHKATIEINEEYSEAATATMKRVILQRLNRGSYITVDHPFMYFVWDRGTRTPIFSGRITNLPNSTSTNRFGRYGEYPKVSTDPRLADIILSSYNPNKPIGNLPMINAGVHKPII